MNRIKEIRLAKGISQKFIAVSCGVSSASVCAWEKGYSYPTQENLVKLSQILDAPVGYILGLDQEPTSVENDIDDLTKVAKTFSAEEIIKDLERQDTAFALLSGLSPENKQKALAYIKYLEITQDK